MKIQSLLLVLISGSNYECSTRPNGPTYMQSVTFDSKGPVVEALLAYSQAGDTTRPYHRDQTRRYSDKEWIRLPFSKSEISEQAVGEMIKLRE